MGLFWGSSNNNKAPKKGDEAVEESNIPDDLADYLNTKESQLSNREFKALLRRQSANVESAKQADKEGNVTTEGGDFLSMIQAKGPNSKESKDVNVISDKEGNKIEIPKMPSGISTANSMKKPKEYQSFEFEKYRRENDEKEVVLTNCSEIQHAFYDCLGRQKVWDRITAVARLDTDECTKLADFFMACTEIQKKAFLTFDYATLESIEEMKTASSRIDKVFTKTFKNVDDVREKEKYMEYTRDLRREREDFFVKFNK